MNFDTYRQDGDKLYAVLNGTLQDKPIAHFSSTAACQFKPLWVGTEYQEWTEVMPILIELPTTHPFIDWVDNEAPNDWGFFILSTYDFDSVFQHMQSLTQVYLPNEDNAVFFRFFDPENSFKILSYCNETEQQTLMGPCHHWLSTGANMKEVTTCHNPEPKFAPMLFPWWSVPEAVVEQYQQEDKGALIINVHTWLTDNRPGLIRRYPKGILNKKIEKIVQSHTGGFEDLIKHVIDVLA